MRQATIGAQAPVLPIRFISGVAVIALLAGCQSGPLASRGGDATRATPFGASVERIERDVEAPEIFQMQDLALWDGRPSLGGVWIAAPDVRRPERVLIRNDENGKTVVAALFNRERDNPGPILQLSSEAAIALGVLAGAPTNVDVVALKREDLPEPDPAVALEAIEDAPLSDEPLAAETDLTADLGEALEAAPAETGATETETLIAAAAAALDLPSEDSELAGIELDDTSDVAAAPPELIIDPDDPLAAPILATPATAEVAPRRNIFQRLFRRDRAGAAPADPTGLNPSPLEAERSEDPVATSAAAPAIEATPLDALPEAGRETEVAALAPEVDPTPTPAPTDDADLTFVQIGTFSVAENARETADTLAGAGIVATVLEERNGAKPFWRVVVGPALNPDDRAAILRTARGLGFTDAYAVQG